MIRFLKVAFVIVAAFVFAFVGLAAGASASTHYSHAEHVAASAAVSASYPLGTIAQYRSEKMRWVSQGKGFAVWSSPSGWTKFQLIFLSGSRIEFQTNANHYCVFVYKPSRPSVEPFLALTGHSCSGKADQTFTIRTSDGAAQYESDETFGYVNMRGLGSQGVGVGAPGNDIYTHWRPLG